MKQINPYVSPVKPVEQKSKTPWGAIGTLAGAAIGSAVAPGGGTMAGMQAGAALGGAAGSGAEAFLPNKQASQPAQAVSPTIPVPGGDNAMSRRQAAMDNDAFAQLRSAATALPNLSPEVQQTAGPSILKGLMANARGGRTA